MLRPGLITPPKRKHDAADIALCKTMGAAIDRARIHAGMTQETLAGRCGISQQYLSLCLAGKRRWPVDVVVAVANTTGSMAPIQWICKRVGGELHIDKLEQRKAALRAELEELEGRAA